MSPLSLFLLSLLALLGGVPSAAASMTTAVWHRAQVSKEQLTAAAMSTSYQVFNEILCAILATNTPWCHLFTHEGNTCVLYDVVVDSLAAPPPEDTATLCKTRHRHAVSLTCDGPFMRVNVGCVYLDKNKTEWCEARHFCESLEADLAVVPPESFSVLQQFLLDNAKHNGVWVGARARKWLDGRQVAKNEWATGQPNKSPEQCLRLKLSNDTYYFADNTCNQKYWALCMRT